MKESNKNTVHHPNPKRFDYRTGLLRERYLASIGAIPVSDIVHEFMYHRPVTPPHTIVAASPSIPQNEAIHLSPKLPHDFKCISVESVVNSIDSCVPVDDVKEEECKNN